MFDESLVSEQLSRNISFLGQERVDRLRECFVIVVGLGGVGSHAAHMLLRSGVENLRLVDFDQVTLSSLNRHAVATHKDVGTSKVVAMKKHLLQIAPWAKIEACNELFHAERADALLSASEGNRVPDLVLDCIDNLETKVQLLEYCHKANIKVCREDIILKLGGSSFKID